jgi:hypothetical protein
MKRLLSLLIASALALHAQDSDTPPPAPSPSSERNTPLPPPAPIDDGTVSHQGYVAGRYETLWTRSPFAVETPEAAAESPDYSLVGVAEVDGVTYASLIQKGNGEQFIISSAKAERGLTLTSIKRGKGDGDDTTATINRNGEILSLKMEQAPVATPSVVPNMGVGNINSMPGSLTPQMMTPVIPMPGSSSQPPTRPLIRIHRPPIHVPPRPAQAAPMDNSAPAQAQPNTAPPPPPGQ